ncbi:MAG: WD40/YVTN/BNR-like repeat-containing protein [Terriglobales bacterium]
MRPCLSLRRSPLPVLLALAALSLAAWPQTAARVRPGSMLDRVLDALPLRNIGPFRDGSWLTSIAVPVAPAHDHLYTIWVGERSGGVWKTTNSGVTWDPVFDSMGVQSIGAVAIARSDPNTVWVGTGDNASARSSYSGKGVFKTTDGGKTWQAMGLADSEHIARIVIDPQDPNVVYVAALGHLFSANAERGVFRTRDGGKSWKKVLYVNDETGAVDLVMNQHAPATLYAALYDKQRLPWRLIEGGPASAVYRSDDGGEHWRKLTGGLPTGTLGRIGLDLYQKNPNIVYALIENLNPRPAAARTGAGARAGQGGRGLGGRPRPPAVIGNQLYRSDDRGESWRLTSAVNVAGGKAPYSFNQVRVDPGDPQRVIVNSDNMYISEDGGATWNDRTVWPRGFFGRAFGDFRTMWFDPADPRRILLGSDGGLQISYDGGHTSDFFPNIKAGEAYAVGVDMDDPYHVYAGFQDHDSWKGPVNGRWGVITLEDWVTVGPGDGMYNVVDPTDSRWVYNTRELNQLGRMDERTGVRTDIRPPQSLYPERLRYNWIAPIALSPEDPKTLYAGAQVLFRSRDRGDHWEVISPDLTTNDKSKIGFPSTPYCTISTLSPSPLSEDEIWVGTDDGKVQLTRNGGATWTDLTPRLTASGAPADRWVSRVFASPHNAGTAFVAKSGFHNDDFHPYLYKTTDYGQTWTALSAGLPQAPINVIVQDRRNSHLLFVGNDLGVYVSLDDGAHWSRLQSNLPTIPVQDLLIHPRENDLVLATYGRALWVGDISPLQQMSLATLQQNVHLFDIQPHARYQFSTQGMNYELYGDKYLQVPDQPDAWTVYYYLKSAADAPAHLTVMGPDGKTVRSLQGPARAGLNKILVNLDGGRGRFARGRGHRPPEPPLAIGNYQVTLTVDGQTLTKVGTVRAVLAAKGGR